MESNKETLKGAYIKYAGAGGSGGIYKFLKKKFVA